MIQTSGLDLFATHDLVLGAKSMHAMLGYPITDWFQPAHASSRAKRGVDPVRDPRAMCGSRSLRDLDVIQCWKSIERIIRS